MTATVPPVQNQAAPICANCLHSVKRLSFLGWRLRCTRFKIPVVSAKPCSDWRLKAAQ